MLPRMPGGSAAIGQTERARLSQIQTTSNLTLTRGNAKLRKIKEKKTW